MGGGQKIIFKYGFKLLLTVIVPASVLFITMGDDIQNSELQPIEFSVIARQAPNALIEVGEIPIDTLISLYIERVEGSFSNGTVYGIENYQFSKFLNGEYNLSKFQPREEFTNKEGSFRNIWFNFTTGTPGELRFVFTTNVDGIKIDGFYQYDVDPFFFRQGFNVFILFGIYYLILFRLMPILMLKFGWYRSQRKLRLERLGEEVDFFFRDIEDV